MKRLIRLSFLVLLISPISNLFANNSYPDSVARQEVVLFADLFDSLYFHSVSLNESVATNPRTYHYESDYIPNFSDSILQQRIHEMDITSPFNYAFNEEVKAAIILYSTKRRGFISRMLAKADEYFPLFEELLDKYNLPLELKYLAVIESALNPTAKSHAGAMGLWQFMPGTGAMYDLTCNSIIDQRKNIYAATEAACRHFVDLYNIYHDWNLVLAAYNAGAGNVNRAIKRSGDKQTYWEIYDFLPRETRGYVPTFIAVNYMMKYHVQHNIFSANEGVTSLNTALDTIYINQKMSFYEVARMANVSVETVQELNPQYSKKIIFANPNQSLIITLPKEAIANFIRYRNDILLLELEAKLEN